MAVQRITVSLPTDVYKDLQEFTQTGGVSEFITKSIKSTIQTLKVRRKKSVVDEIKRLRKNSPKYSLDEIMDFIDKGRP